MSLIDFIRSVEEAQDEFDVELEEFDPESEQADVADDAGGRSYGRLFLAVLLLAGVAYAVYRLRSSSSGTFTDIALEERSVETDEDATVTVEHDPDDEATDETDAESDDADGDEDDSAADDSDATRDGHESAGDESEDAVDADSDADDNGIEVEVESSGDDDDADS
ncbi:hypothetical protein C440_12334 [Haloferax mucosum ATCC BAA-1512]|uniref:Uncharacterized protein n=1 Tax=Haloferax mucosum ATCC BAA-1512 TaxID=662479 RepID=M0I7Y6_9EURY|nr:hypothetical protein [Haloferax mucosum]ELZ92906.1 hypothetical protein C440_12334 [Haloferax mucosum ATCC BAA-1512]